MHAYILVAIIYALSPYNGTYNHVVDVTQQKYSDKESCEEAATFIKTALERSFNVRTKCIKPK